MAISQSSVQLTGGIPLIKLTIPLLLPSRANSALTGKPRTSQLSKSQLATGGSLSGDTNYYYFLVAVDASSGRGRVSEPIEVLVPAGTNTNQVTISGDFPFDGNAATYEVYRSIGDPWTPERIISGAIPSPFTFTDNGLVASAIVAPDDNFDHANVYWRKNGDAFWNLAASTSDWSQTSVDFYLPLNVQGQTLNIQVRPVSASGHEMHEAMCPTTNFVVTGVAPDYIEVNDSDGTPVASRRLRVVDGVIRFASVAGTPGQYANLSDVADDVVGDRRASSADQKTGGDRAFTQIDSNGLYDTLDYHNSALREPSSVSRNGTTTNSTWTTVASFDLELGKSVTYQGTLAVTRSSITSNGNDGPNAASSGSGWTNSNNITADDAAYATDNMVGGPGSQLVVTLPTPSLPSTGLLTGIDIVVKRKRSSGTQRQIEDSTVKLRKSGVAVGPEKANSGAAWPTSDGSYTYSWTLAELQAAGVSLADVNNGLIGFELTAQETIGLNATDAMVNYITVKWYYATYTMKARLKVGGSISSEVSISNPNSADSATVNIPGVGPGAITVEVQAQVTAGTGTVQADFTQKRYTDAHKDNVQ